MEFNNKLKHVFLIENWETKRVYIAYKLLFDALFLELVFFAIAILAEGIIPGIITSHVGFSKIIILIALTILAIFHLVSFIKINSPAKLDLNKKTVFFLLVFASLVMLNSQFKLNIFLNLSLLVIALALGYFIFQVLLEEDSL